MPTPPMLNVPMLPNEVARATNGQVQVRPDAVRARWTLSDLVTADNHRLRGTFTCGLRPSADAADRKLLAETFLSRKASAVVDDVVAHFAPGLQAAAATVASSKAVTEWLDGSVAKESLADALRKAVDKAAFACGLETLPPFQLDLESPSFQQQRLEAMERNLAQQRVAGQVEHFEKAAGLLKQFDALRQAAPGISPGAILQQISPSDQGTMLQTLLLAAAKGTAARQLWAVAGPALVRIDPRASMQAAQLVNLPTTLGPLRSVQPAELDGKPVLLVGARSGVMVVDAESPTTPPAIYQDTGVVSQLGFNRTILWRHGVWSCHAEAGVVGWDIGAGDHPKVVYRPAQFGAVAPAPAPVGSSGASMVSMESGKAPGARNVTALDNERLIFSVGPRLFTVNADGQLTAIPGDARGDVVSLLPEGSSLFVIHEDGLVSTRDRQTLAVTGEQRRGGRILAATRMPWLGSARLLLATDAGPIVCMGTEDPLVTEYLSNHHGLRHLAATADSIAAMSADRQRIVLWNPWETRKPAGEVSVASQARHRIGDVTFG